MKPCSLATLEKLETANWFSQVGDMTGIKYPEKIVMLTSWKEAIESCGSIEWEDLCLEAREQYRARLLERNKDRWRQWNQVTESVKPAVADLVARKTAEVIDQFRLPEVFSNTVSWDMLGLLMESEYSDVYPPGFFAANAFWYVKGHFPCGWEGEFPTGRIIIY